MIRFILVYILAHFVLILKGQENPCELSENIKVLSHLSDTVSISAHPLRKYFFQNTEAFTFDHRTIELAATFDDPSRMVLRLPGVSTNNDQANGIVYHGLPSYFTKWSVHGVEVVNPNHLSNAGTRTDLSSANAGGVLGVPFEAMQSFSFYNAPTLAHQPNALSGVGDINLDRYDNNFVKAGLIGMEFGLGQKIGQDFKLRVNGRYSFVGVLTALGADFGGESIDFYDGSFSINYKEKFGLFAFGGKSNNNFEGVDTLSNAGEIKDLQNIDFGSGFYGVGIKYEDERMYHVIGYSTLESKRTTIFNFLSDNFQSFYPNQILENSKLSHLSQWTFRKNKRTWRLGVRSLLENLDRFNFQLKRSYTMPFASYENRFAFNKWQLNVQSEIEFPIGKSHMHLNSCLALDAYAGNAIISLTVDLFNNNGYLIDDEYQSRQSRSFILAYTYQFSDFKTNLKTALFTHTHTQIDRLFAGPYSGAFTGFERLPTDLFDMFSRGFDISLDRQWAKDFHTHVNISLFNATVEDDDSNVYSTEENFGQVLNVTFSKFIKNKKKGLWKINLTGHYRGGAGQYYLSDDKARFAILTLRDYYRVDLRIDYSLRKSQLVLDLQNVTNRVNDAFNFYDPYLAETTLTRQLGLIPNLSYRRRF